MSVNNFRNNSIFGFFILSIAACSPRVEYSNIKWTQGESFESLDKLKHIEINNENSTVVFNQKKIAFSSQKLNGTQVHNTFIKKILNSENEPLQVEAVIIPVRPFGKYLLSRDQTKKDLKHYLSQLGLGINDFKHEQFKSEYFKENDHFAKYTLFNYEKNDGTLWQAIFDHTDKLLKNNRLGSNFIDTYASVYPFGPKLSGLETVFFSQLDSNNILSNDFVRVDNESVSKISNIPSVMKFDPKEDQFDQVQVFHYLNSSIQWMKDFLNISFPNKIQAVVNVGYPRKTNTAFYYDQKIRLGRGDDVDYAMISSDPSIVFHESFHFLIDGLARLPFDSEGGSMNEAFADFFTAVALKNPKLGEVAYLKNPFKRSIEKKIVLSEKSGGLYHDSQIISGLMWEIHKTIGELKSLKLAVTTLSELNPASQFSDFNTVLVKNIKLQLSADEAKICSEIIKDRGFLYE